MEKKAAMFEVHDLSNLEEDIRKDEAEMHKKIHVDKENGCITLEGYYDIELDRIDTHHKIVKWVHHLGEKGWVEARVLRRLTLLACRANGLPMPWEAPDKRLKQKG